jgi:hypothetical protein
MGTASRACANLGGHLASERDYTEAIRHGLPNGSGAMLHSSDLASGNLGTVLALSVKWTGVDLGFTDLNPAYAGWLDPVTAAPYRCVWTNELR